MVARPTLNSIPLGRAVDEFMHRVDRDVAANSSRPTQTTADTYRRALADLVRLIGEDVLTDDITGEDLEDALFRYSRLADRRAGEHRDDPLATISGKAGGKSDWSKATFWNSVRRFFTHAEKHALVQVSPVAFVDNPPRVNTRTPRKPERDALDAIEVQALLRWGPGEQPEPGTSVKAQRAHYLWLRNRALLTLLTVAGPRVSEVCRADRQDFTGLASGQVWWRIIGKGQHERSIPLSRDVMDLVVAAWEAQPEPAPGAERAAFLTMRGNRLNPRDVQNLCQDAYERVRAHDRLAARPVVPHGLRHTAATLLSGAGWDIRLIAKMLGHANLATLAVYLDAKSEELIPMMTEHPATPRSRTRARSGPVPAGSVADMRVLPSPDTHTMTENA